MKTIGGTPQHCARRSSPGRYYAELRDYRYLGISRRPPQCQHADSCRFPQTVSRQQNNGMNEEEHHVAASQPKKPSVCHGKILVCHQKPCADASEGQFESHEGHLPIAEDKDQKGVSLLAAAGGVQQRTLRRERRGTEHIERELHLTARGA